MDRNWWSSLDRRRANGVVGIGALIIAAVLVLLALQLRGAQTTERRHLASRFRDRAQVISALTQAVLASASSSQATSRFQAPKVSARVLDTAVTQGHLAYAALLDQHGHIIAASRSLTAPGRAQVLSSRALGPALEGAPVSLSDVMPGGPAGSGVIAFAVPLRAPYGWRVLVSGAPAALFSDFLGGYLRRVPTPAGTAYVLDSQGAVVAARDLRQTAGRRVGDAGLLAAARRSASGNYGRDGYFAAVAVPGSTWRVVLASTRSSLFSSVSGSRRWVPWLIFAALAIVAAGFLALLRRLIGSTAALSSANARLESGNARLESANAMLRNAAELSRSNAELEQFASIASHDLQEPLRKVQTFAARLTATEHDRLSEEGQDFLRRMSDAAGRMRSLIDDLLMFSRVSTKGRPFVPVDLEEVASQVLVDLEVSIEERGASVVVEGLPTIEADPVQMRQLLQNLLGNALKFVRADVTPEISARAEVSDHVAELTIRDNGIGFDAQYATRIFRAFERLNGASAYPGTGMGLALCRKIVERHHGTIRAESEPGRGATFTVRLPLEQLRDSTPVTSLFPDRAGEEARHALV
ncbi:MAG TPA: ATP-binding protein [Solirubrobacteraceae bacterium]|jgi:signal transduction histidine kinase|nr:ATP-binding protein [Solirubrobacteraceae bacterium]